MRLRPWIATPLVVLASCGSSAAKPAGGTSAATASTPTTGTTSAATRCGPASAKTLAANGRVRVYVVRELVYGCSAARGRSFRLGHATRAIDEARVGPVAVAGDLAAYGLANFGVDTVRAQVVVRRLTDGTELKNLRSVRAVGAESFQSIRSLVVRATDAVAWIGSLTSIGRRAGSIEVHAAGASGDRVLDSGPNIDPASLRLDGSSLTWVDGGSTRHATLR